MWWIFCGLPNNPIIINIYTYYLSRPKFIKCMLRKTNEINLDFGLIYDASPGCRSVGDPGAAMKNFYSTFHETF